MAKNRVNYVDMVKGLAILSIAVYHIIAPGVLKTIFSGLSCVLFFAFSFIRAFFINPEKQESRKA